MVRAPHSCAFAIERAFVGKSERAADSRHRAAEAALESPGARRLQLTTAFCIAHSAAAARVETPILL
jgi:hypothetical protein